MCVMAMSLVAAVAQDDSPGTPAPQQPQQDGGGRRGGGRRGGGEGMGGGMMGGGNGVRGTVTSVSDATLILKNSDTGIATAIDLTSNTRLMKERQPIKVGDIKVGDTVMAMGVPEPGKPEIHAAMVMVMTPEQVAQMAAREKEMRENLGKTYIAGSVTAINETKITIMRVDAVAQTITVDENTSFRRGRGGMGMGRNGVAPAAPTPAETPAGESITLADIKVGDSVAGQGALKDGVFVAKTLSVMQGRARVRPLGQQADPTRP
jgi:hypothetical protein